MSAPAVYLTITGEHNRTNFLRPFAWFSSEELWRKVSAELATTQGSEIDRRHFPSNPKRLFRCTPWTVRVIRPNIAAGRIRVLCGRTFWSLLDDILGCNVSFDPKPHQPLPARDLYFNENVRLQ